MVENIKIHQRGKEGPNPICNTGGLPPFLQMILGAKTMSIPIALNVRGEGREGEGRQGKARQGKARQGKGREMGQVMTPVKDLL